MVALSKVKWSRQSFLEFLQSALGTKKESERERILALRSLGMLRARKLFTPKASSHLNGAQNVMTRAFLRVCAMCLRSRVIVREIVSSALSKLMNRITTGRKAIILGNEAI